MAAIIGWISVSIIYLLLLPLADTSPETLVLCQEGRVSGRQANVNMNASFKGSTLSCSCKFSLDVPSKPRLNVQSTNCTNIEISVGLNTLRCKNGKYYWKTPFYLSGVSTKDIWIIVKSNSSNAEHMWGSVHFDGNTTVVCFKQNCNSSSTTMTTVATPTLKSSTTKEHSQTSGESTDAKGDGNNNIQGNTTVECFKPNSFSSSTTMTTVATSMLTPSATEERSSTYGESTDAMPANEQLKGDGNNKLPVALIAGCASGGIILVIVLVILAVACYRRNKKLHQTREGNTRTPPSTHGNNDDEYLSMENELYNSSGDLTYTTYPRQSELKDLFNEVANKTPRDTNCTAPTELVPAKSDGMKTDGVKSQNEDLYQLVHKPRNVNGASPSQLNHNTAPSGDVYAIVVKS